MEQAQSSDEHDEYFEEIIKTVDKSRAYLVTINNYSEEEHNSFFQYFEEKNLVYLVLGREKAPTTGTPHIHVYMYHTNPVCFNPLKKRYPRARIDRCRGTPLQCSVYCKKDGDYDEYGICPEQGKRSDIDHIREVLEETPKMREVVLVAKSYQSIKVAEQYLKYHEKRRNWKPLVKYYYGKTGSGKTRQAIEELGEDRYDCMNTGKWFDGYDGHENVLVDDMRKDFMKFAELLKFLDRYAFRVETKGGTRQFLGKTIIITSCHHPAHLYSTREDINQLLRRIDVIQQFGDEYEPQFDDEDS